MSDNIQYSEEDLQAQKDEIARLEAEKQEAIKEKKRLDKGPTRKEIKEMRKQQKEAIIESMSEAEYEQYELQKMRYTDNKISHTLAYVGVVCSLAAGFIALNSMDPIYFLNGFGGILAILLNIIILLAGFLSAEKVKTYSMGYSKFIIGVGAVCALRIFWYPLSLIILYSQLKGQLSDGIDISTVQSNFKGKLGASMLGLNDSGDGFKTTSYLTANGYIRAIIIIVFLLVAAVSFIVSGYIGMKKTKKLQEYMSTLEEN